MILRALLLFLLFVLVGALLRLLWLRAGAKRGRLFGALGVALLLAGLAWATATGRLHWLVAAPAALLPFLRGIARWLPALSFLRRLRGTLGGVAGPGPAGAAGSAGSGRTETRTRFLAMHLDRATGAIGGTVREGPHAGTSLDDLDRPALATLLRHYRHEDPDSARLLETYLERRFGSTGGTGGGEEEAAGDRPDAPSDGRPTREEALAVLGLEGAPDRETIIRAHRRIMQRCHPDHGGSAHLAAQVNAARDRLLEDLEA
ncbi:MAG: molecular chaperone DnaJ [Pseudomonadales bacterium]|jgi:hypothetical protein|nr:molecular chaperone DnaJ [Pseudomonadales bacterium]